MLLGDFSEVLAAFDFGFQFITFCFAVDQNVACRRLGQDDCPALMSVLETAIRLDQRFLCSEQRILPARADRGKFFLAASRSFTRADSLSC